MITAIANMMTAPLASIAVGTRAAAIKNNSGDQQHQRHNQLDPARDRHGADLAIAVTSSRRLA